MAGYTRQSAASIINGENITAPPLNAEFNQLESSFNDTTGHAHDGTTGNGPKIDLTTSITGFLPAEHGGFGGKNNYVATTNPGVGDDTNDGYAVGSVWYNVPDDRYWVCVYAAAGAAVWLENRFIDTNGDIAPFATNTVDLGATLKRFKDLFLSGNADIDGSLNVATTAYVGGTLTVAGNTLLNGDITLGNSATDDINVTARFKDDLVPGTDDTYDLGTSTLQWRNIWIDGTANIDTLDVHENATVTGTLGVTGDATFANLDATGTTTITSVDLNSGAIDNATIGATTPAAATVTTLTSTGLATLASVDVNGGNVDNTVIGGTTPAAGTFTNLTSSGTSTHASVDINGGNIDATVIGASSAAAGSFTSLTTSGQATLATVDINGGNIDGAAIGSTTTSSGAFTTLSASGGITGTLTGNVTGNVTGDITGDVTGDLTGNVTAATGSSSFNNVTINGSLNMNAGTSATITNLTAPVNTLDAATKGYVDTSIANLVDSAPGTLDTLNELAAALGDDPNFSTTITNSIATKLSLNGGTMAGDIAMGSNSITGMADPAAAQDAATKNYTDTTFLALSGGTMTGAISMGANKVTSSATPSTGNDLTNKTYVDGIFGSATAASASAAAAATSETNAATSETNAANSATAAASSATSAANSYDDFDDRYLGAKATAPTVDNDGDALITGALYFDTTTNTMKVYGTSGWVNAGSSVNGTTDRQTYTATAGQTVFAATYDAGYVDVYLNGVKLLAGTDFTATNGTSITLASGAAVNDIVDIVAYGTFVLADHLTETQSDAKYVELAGDTMTGNLDVGGTVTADQLTVYNGTSDPDVLFRNNGTGDVTLTFRRGAADDVYTDWSLINDNGTFTFRSDNSSDPDRTQLTMSQGDISFYDGSGNAKFFWDSSAERLGVGTDTPSDVLELTADSTDFGLLINNATGNPSRITLTNSEGSGIIDENNGLMRFNQSGAFDAVIDSAGRVGIGVTPENWDTSNTVLAVGSAAFMYGSTNTSLVSMGANAYYDSADGRWEYTNSDYASRYQQLDGKHIWSTAPSGTANAALTWSESMRIDANGSVGIGGISPQSNGGATAKVVHTHNTAAGNWAINHWTTGSTGAAGGDGFIAGVIGSDAYLYNYEASDMIFATNSNERLKIDAFGGLTIRSVNTTAAAFGGTNVVNGITALPSTAGTPFVVGRDTGTTRSAHFAGNLKFDNGYGIDFDASSGSGRTSSVLDDYEEGTWTPTDNGAANASISIISASYTKIGRSVTINMYVTVSASSSGNMQIGGLPFTPIASDNYHVSPINHNTSAGECLLRVQPNSTVAQVLQFNNTAKAWSAFNGSIFITSITYQTA